MESVLNENQDKRSSGNEARRKNAPGGDKKKEENTLSFKKDKPIDLKKLSQLKVNTAELTHLG